ncbi:hypothetical protein [Dendronalium sp. ChiSLP03b]|uniref:hypothetical protein n=1 Tax=Dendronalium sp. ChiSLP03b TaxID=3075381 RepID=UPI002AD3B552|nr:hypothetical protein [Dendronalium sp. ChiSLP03b]MDZ8205629.1 hypothetical protein [Dendronalium sp. ChiSLP03b]
MNHKGEGSHVLRQRRVPRGFPRHLLQRRNLPSGSQFLQVGEAAQRTAHRNAVAPHEQLPKGLIDLNGLPVPKH